MLTLDDLIVYAQTWEQHFHTHKQVFMFVQTLVYVFGQTHESFSHFIDTYLSKQFGGGQV